MKSGTLRKNVNTMTYFTILYASSPNVVPFAQPWNDLRHCSDDMKDFSGRQQTVSWSIEPMETDCIA